MMWKTEGGNQPAEEFWVGDSGDIGKLLNILNMDGYGYDVLMLAFVSAFKLI